MQPLVSVIIPCYNQAHFLVEAIESVLAQAYQPYEIIVVDDSSPDNVAEVSGRYPTAQLYRTAGTRGVSGARNLGFEKCRGDYLVFLDADDRLLPSALSAGVAALSTRPRCAMVWGRRRLIDATGNLLPSEPLAWHGSATYKDMLQKNLVGAPGAVMFRRESLEQAGGFALGISGTEDHELYLRMARLYETYGHGELVAEYRMHDDNMSLNYERMLRSGLAVLELQELWVRDDPELSRARAAGRRHVHELFDWEARLVELHDQLRARRWGKALTGAVTLAYKYPRLFLPILLHRITRRFRRRP